MPSLVIRIASSEKNHEYELAGAGVRAWLESRASKGAKGGSLGAIYGCGPLVPGYNFDGLLDCARKGELRAIVGLTITEDAITGWSNILREKVAAILQLAPKVYCADPLSVEWALHYGLNAQLGGHPGWLAPFSGPLPANENPVRVAENVGDAMDHFIVSAATGRINPVLRVPKQHQHMLGGKPKLYHPLLRFAEMHNCEKAICYENEEVPQTAFEDVTGLAPAVVEKARQAARDTLDEIFAPEEEKSPEQMVDDLLSTPHEVGPDGQWKASDTGPRKLELGSVFDPATHYTEHYYDGRGLLYCKPDGEWDVYHGTALQWEGNKEVARILAQLTDKKGNLLDIGCSAGDFVECVCNTGREAYGVDISQKAVNRSNEAIHWRLIGGYDFADILQQKHHEVIVEGSEWKITTAWDFWEHLYLGQIEGAIGSLHKLTAAPDGLHFAVICTRSDLEKDWTIRPGDKFTLENSWLLAAGHVTIRTWEWWVDMFGDNGFKFRPDLAYEFQVKLAEHPSMSQCKAWSPRNLFCFERI
jgi:hypothetical protein